MTPEKSGAELAYEIATAIQHLARQQMEMEQRLGGRIDAMGRWAKATSNRLDSVEERLSSLELSVGPETAITEQQGTKPGYSQVYGELYRRYGISSYKNLPRDKYDEVLAWLKRWHEELGGA